MAKADKILEKLYKNPPPKNFTWNELCTLLTSIGFEQKEGRGSRVKFIYPKLNYPISLHKPHPGNELKGYLIEDIRKALDDIEEFN